MAISGLAWPCEVIAFRRNRRRKSGNPAEAALYCAAAEAQKTPPRAILGLAGGTLRKNRPVPPWSPMVVPGRKKIDWIWLVCGQDALNQKIPRSRQGRDVGQQDAAAVDITEVNRHPVIARGHVKVLNTLNLETGEVNLKYGIIFPDVSVGARMDWCVQRSDSPRCRARCFSCSMAGPVCATPCLNLYFDRGLSCWRWRFFRKPGPCPENGGFCEKCLAYTKKSPASGRVVRSASRRVPPSTSVRSISHPVITGGHV